MNPLLKILGVGKPFEDFDGEVENLGWVKACRNLMGKLKIEVGSDLLFPEKGALIVTSNHPSGLDPYLLTAALGREDSYFWGDIYQTMKGGKVASHIVQIAPPPFWTIVKRPPTNWPGYVYMRIVSPAKNREESKEINKKATARTVQLLGRGSAVIIFPSGGEYEFLPKKKGIERVIAECTKKGIEARVINLRITGFGELRLLIHFLFGTRLKAQISLV